MVNEMLKGISTQLYDVFGADYKYYVENVEQKLSKPCFTIDSLLPLQRSRNRVLYDRTIPVVVHYFTSEKSTTKQDCYDKAELIVEALEYVPFHGSLIRGENISYQIVDDVLQVFVTYRFITKKLTSNEDNMENLDGHNFSSK
jgi:hypothetical protein